MTTITGVQLIDYAVLVADSQITEDNLVTLAVTTPKIIEVGKYLIGISGDTRPGDILAYNWKPPLYRGEDPVQFMGKKVIPSINQAFTDNNYDYNKVDKDGGFDYLIAFNGNIFRPLPIPSEASPTILFKLRSPSVACPADTPPASDNANSNCFSSL